MPHHWAHNFDVEEDAEQKTTQVTILERDGKEGPTAVIIYSISPNNVFQININRPYSDVERGMEEDITILGYSNYDQAIHDAKIIIYAMWKDQLEYEELCEKYGTGSVSPML